MYIVRSTNPEEVVVSLSQASDHLGYTDNNIQYSQIRYPVTYDSQIIDAEIRNEVAMVV